MREGEHDLPLFPLHSVLFPGGLLGLRVFEARYMDLIARCLKTGDTFGVVLILSGSEVRQAAQSPDLAAVGCSARVLDCDMQEPGLLHVRCKGESRFVLRSHGPVALGLEMGRVQAMADDPPAPLEARHAAASMALGRAHRGTRRATPATVPAALSARFARLGRQSMGRDPADRP